MVNNWKLSWDHISPALKYNTKHSDKTLKKKKKIKNIYQKLNTKMQNQQLKSREVFVKFT